MMKTLKIIFVTLLLLSVLSVTAFAAEFKSTGVYDKADILSESDEAAISGYLSEASEKTGSQYILFTSKNDSDKAYMFETAYDIVALEIVYIEDEDAYYYYFYTFGDPYYSIEDGEIDRVLDDPDVYDNLKSGKIKEGAHAFCTLAVLAEEGDLREPLWQTILISFIIAAAIAGITVGCIIYKYKKKLKSPSYPLERYAGMNLEFSTDNFMGSFVTKTKISTSSSSGRSGGGRSGGGGGGRRGGR